MNKNFQVMGLPIFKDNYLWVVLNEEKTKAIAIDPGEASTLIHFLEKEKINLEAVLITHHHFDHANGILELKKYCEAKVYGPLNEVIPGVDEKVSEKDEIEISFLSEPIKIIDIPGHTEGHIGYYFSNLLFCGDTLFSAGCGRVFGGTPELLYLSLEKIATFPDRTKLYCAHEYTLNNLRFAEKVEPDNQKIHEKIQAVINLREKNLPTIPSTLLEEKEMNPFLRCKNKSIIESIEKNRNVKIDKPVEAFRFLREWKDDFVVG